MQDEPLDPLLQQAVSRAIDQGVDALLAEQELDGSWRMHQGGYYAGMTALALYALLKSGVPRDHVAVRRATNYLRYQFPRKTYSAACQLLAFCALGESVEREHVQAIVDKLVSFQKLGGFSYPKGRVDLSNTQFAALGLRAAAAAGYDVPSRVWEKLAELTIEHQESPGGRNEPAGFVYHDDREVTGSMTAAGVAILAICAEQGVVERQIEQSISLGLRWLAREFTVDENPGEAEHHLYYLYGLERVGGILALERLGEHDWYGAGARKLVRMQRHDGRWGTQPQTAFALLFLSKATAPVTGEAAAQRKLVYVTDEPDADVVLRATGRNPFTLWVASLGSSVADLVWEGDEGKGPRVLSVSFRSSDDTLLASVEADPLVPMGAERYAVQHTFANPGVHGVFATLEILRPGFEPGRSGSVATMRSPLLELRVAQSYNEELLGYSDDPGRNLLRDARAKAVTSSDASDWFAGKRLLDNRQSSAWRSADGDPHPSITIELGKHVKANTLVLSHTFNPAFPDPTRTSRVHRASVSVNGKKKPIDFEMIPDEWRKTAVSLGKTTKIRSLEIKVLSVLPEPGWTEGVGFAELELQLRK